LGREVEFEAPLPTDLVEFCEEKGLLGPHCCPVRQQ
jgi:hypothetical protein